jgi:hypothetical protein
MVPDAGNLKVVKGGFWWDTGGRGLENMDTRGRRVAPREDGMRNGSLGGKLACGME